MSECYPSSVILPLSCRLPLDTASTSSSDFTIPTFRFCKVLSCLTHTVNFPAPKLFFFASYCTPIASFAYLPNIDAVVYHL
jgi:hypothetical protein